MKTLTLLSTRRSTRMQHRTAPAFQTALILSLFWILNPALQAQVIGANGQISGSPAGGGIYSYNIALNNTGSSPVQTFWYSWVPGADFLPSTPTTVQPPTGWTYMVQGGPYYDPYGYYYPDGYSIEFYTSTAPLNPGSSLNFGFTSTDSPAALAGNSPIFTYYPVGTSYVFSGIGESGLSSQFIVQSVPEPSALSLLVAGLAGYWAISRFRPRARSLQGIAFARQRTTHH